jgi:hypothetical protein
MPARRSRTLNWLDSLHRICERQGPIEITLDSAAGAAPNDSASRNLIWRVRVVEVSKDSIVIEQPVAVGAAIPLRDGMPIVGIMSVGQNRWMFHTRILETCRAGRSMSPAYRLAMPSEVERCQRRNFYRISTAELSLPPVEMGMILDLEEARLVEEACRAEINRMLDSGIAGKVGAHPAPMAPPLGDQCTAHMVNLGGGGVGLAVHQDHAHLTDSSKHLWLSIDLCPEIPAPLGVVGRIRHTHAEPGGPIYAGLSFDFAHDGRHERFIAGLLTRFVAEVQREIRTDAAASGR